MRLRDLFDKAFFRYTFSFVVVLIVSFAVIVTVEYYRGVFEPPPSCITSAGVPC